MMKKRNMIFFSTILMIVPFSNTWAMADTTETIVIMRHAEKPSQGLGQLTCQGLNRALALPAVLNEKFGKPDHIFAPNPTEQVNEGAGKGTYYYVRPLATIEPTAISLGMPVNTKYGFSAIDNKNGLASALLASSNHSARIFVAWEHKYAVKLAEAIATATGYKGQIPSWGSNEYDTLYVFTIIWNGAQANTKFEVQSEKLDGSSAVCPIR